jgi:Zn finger protein HypA/HybF involved in hydrogenase expression
MEVARITEERKPFWAKCSGCSHIWACAYLPMCMADMGELLKRVRCPNCASAKVFIAKQNNGTLQEPIPSPPNGSGEQT